LAQVDVKSLLCIILSLLVVTMILCPTYSFSTARPEYYSETGKYNNQLYIQREIVGKDLAGGTLESNAINKIIPTRIEDQKGSNLASNSNFSIVDNQSGLPLYWNDSLNICGRTYTCKMNVTDGWDDRQSFQLSTTNNTNKTWLSIKGREINVKPGEQLQLVSHMKLNKWATQSHIALEGFNETSKQWYQFRQCPSGVDGPLEWQEFSCVITIPENTTGIRPVLNAGWSSDAKEEAATWFDSISVIKEGAPFVTDPNLKVEALYDGLEHPTSMAFLGQDDILVLEKNKGTIQRIVNGVKLREPIVDLAVRHNDGLLGIAIDKNMTTGQNSIVQSTYVFLYFTAAEKGDKDQTEEEAPARNRLYRYELENNTLVNPKLLLDLPAALTQNAGKIVIGPDKYIYLSVGELRNRSASDPRNKALNYGGESGGNEADGRGSIMRIDQNGRTTSPILGNKEPLNKYYAYGIRNSFGMDFDPLTGKLWDTENGPEWGDESNLAEPGFNSGWNKVQGVWTVGEGESRGDLASEKPDNLVDFDGMGKYSAPEFTWHNTVAPTALKFLTTDKLGKDYKNDMFVGDAKTGRIYHFELNQNRTELLLNGSLRDKVGNTYDELDPLVFARGFGLISDLEIGPDGYLYVVVLDDGKIFRIVSNDLN
jgi:glucose/arabinose dehydrogenase